jgi:hypothetical protein
LVAFRSLSVPYNFLELSGRSRPAANSRSGPVACDNFIWAIARWQLHFYRRSETRRISEGLKKLGMNMVPTRLFFTKGVGKHKERLTSFEMALRDAGIAAQNLVRVSSIFPPNC